MFQSLSLSHQGWNFSMKALWIVLYEHLAQVYLQGVCLYQTQLSFLIVVHRFCIIFIFRFHSEDLWFPLLWQTVTKVKFNQMYFRNVILIRHHLKILTCAWVFSFSFICFNFFLGFSSLLSIFSFFFFLFRLLILSL